MRRLAGFLITGLVIAAAAGPPAFAQTFNSGSTGADGAFSPTANTTLTLPPNGVFNFTTINIPAGVTVTFTRNAANTPVTMLATGDVTIAGTINVAGAAGGFPSSNTSTVGGNGGRGGPGGFDGGAGATGFISLTGGAGLGPGGAAGSTAVAFNQTVPGAGGAGHLTAGATGIQGSGQGTVGAGGGAPTARRRCCRWSEDPAAEAAAALPAGQEEAGAGEEARCSSPREARSPCPERAAFSPRGVTPSAH